MNTAKKDPKAERRVGPTFNWLFCSRCNEKRSPIGGGTVRGRWYGACCKPKKAVQ